MILRVHNLSVRVVLKKIFNLCSHKKAINTTSTMGLKELCKTINYTLVFCMLQTWKKSGAWFYNEIPAYILPPPSASPTAATSQSDLHAGFSPAKKLSSHSGGHSGGHRVKGELGTVEDTLQLSVESLISNSSGRFRDTSRGRDG